MEIVVEKAKTLDEGAYVGTIIDVQYRDTPFLYTDVIIEVNKIQLTAGYPTCVTKNSKLGQLLNRFGGKLVEGKNIDPNKILVEQECKFLVENQVTDKGTFSNIISTSVKPYDKTIVE